MSRRRPILAKPRRRAARRAQAAREARTRIVVADSVAIDRGGLVGLLEDERDFEVVGEAASVREAVRQCTALKPHVLLLSLNLQGQEEQAAIPAIRQALPRLRIVALSERGADNCLVLNPPYRQQTAAELKLVCSVGMDCLQLAVTQGAMATVRRSADPEDLFRAIRGAAEGSAWYDPTTMTGILSATGPDGPRAKGSMFSPRELEVAGLIAEGQSNKEISTTLGISEPTVKKHVGRILVKLGLPDRLQAGLLLARNPLLLKH
jgi:DNA-binding NarL/FixJ family response regulator